MYITHIEAFCKRKATICPRNDTSEHGITSRCNQGKNQGRWTLGKHHMFALWSEFKETSSTCYLQCICGIKQLMNCSLASLYTGLIANSTIFSTTVVDSRRLLEDASIAFAWNSERETAPAQQYYLLQHHQCMCPMPGTDV